MPDYGLTSYDTRHLSATSTTVLYEWFTDWQVCDGIDNIRAVLKARNAAASNFQWWLAIQYAEYRIDQPDPPSVLGSAQVSNGDYSTGDLSVASTMAIKRYFRLGIAYSDAPSTSGVQQADVSLQASWKSVATQLGRRIVTLGINDGATKYEPLTGWVPATFMTKIKAALMLYGLSPTNGNFKYQLAYQTAPTTIQRPSAWVDAETNGFVTIGSGLNYSERNTGEVGLTTSDMWFRIGLAYSTATGMGYNMSVTLDAIVSCR